MTRRWTRLLILSEPADQYFLLLAPLLGSFFHGVHE